MRFSHGFTCVGADTELKFDEVNSNWDDMRADCTYTLAELKREFKERSIVSTMQCSGNRGDLTVFSGSKGNHPQNGFISNAKWTGVYLRDVLLKCIDTCEQQNIAHTSDKSDKSEKSVTESNSESDSSVTKHSVFSPIFDSSDTKDDTKFATKSDSSPDTKSDTKSDIKSDTKDDTFSDSSDTDLSGFGPYKYVTFYGMDTDMSCMHYATSIPLAHVMDTSNQVLLAYSMNDAPLLADHGYPLRVYIPGVAGCRSVKWVGKILLTRDECDSQWQSAFYSPFGKHIYDMPVSSVITRPAPGTRLVSDRSGVSGVSVVNSANTGMCGVNDVKSGVKDVCGVSGVESGVVHVQGWAWTGGGRGVMRVECSVNDGVTWHDCVLEEGVEQAYQRKWAWVLWSVDIPMDEIKKSVKSESGNVEIVCRAFDNAFNSQPKDPKSIVNGTMYVNNSWHRVNVTL